jgi:hypothetical protein
MKARGSFKYDILNYFLIGLLFRQNGLYVNSKFKEIEVPENVKKSFDNYVLQKNKFSISF